MLERRRLCPPGESGTISIKHHVATLTKLAALTRQTSRGTVLLLELARKMPSL
jgi:hypothetical protein